MPSTTLYDIDGDMGSGESVKKPPAESDKFVVRTVCRRLFSVPATLKTDTETRRITKSDNVV
ncbi:MAG TPA: hypothetical protein VN620_15250, partial [Candidatus Methylomirabilis sp.]|nr:hypothetical protein [Candidatus Methylomirabilis sp.]